MGSNPHLPYADSAPVFTEETVTLIVEGFCNVYRVLAAHKDILLADDGPLSEFRKCQFRYNMRATSGYLSINNLCMIPEALKSGEDFCNTIHSIRVQIPSIFSRALPADMRLEELIMLSELDVPRFSVYPEDKCLSHGEYRFEDIMDYSGYELVRQRILDMGDEDMQAQATYIRESLRVLQ